MNDAYTIFLLEEETIMYRRKPSKAARGRCVYSVYGTQGAGFHLAKKCGVQGEAMRPSFHQAEMSAKGMLRKNIREVMAALE